jgi:hypothetical protein
MNLIISSMKLLLLLTITAFILSGVLLNLIAENKSLTRDLQKNTAISTGTQSSSSTSAIRAYPYYPRDPEDPNYDEAMRPFLRNNK